MTYNLLAHGGSRSLLYVRREIKHGRKVRGKGNDLSLSIWRFNSIDVAKKARVVRWNYGLDEDVRAGLVRLLAAPKRAKKRKVSEVSPANGDGDALAPAPRSRWSESRPMYQPRTRGAAGARGATRGGRARRSPPRHRARPQPNILAMCQRTALHALIKSSL